jgi:glycosyltransferase involved in cell wall biosynthesis
LDRRFFAGTTIITRCLLEQKNLIGGPSAVLFRRSCATRGFDENYFHAADLEMWFHLLEQGCFGYLAEPLVAFRWHPRMQTEKDLGTLSQANDQRAMLSTYLEKPYLRLRPWLKKFLAHDAVRQTLRRSRKIKEPGAAAAALREYGGVRQYYSGYPRFFIWRKLAKLSSNIYNRILPYYGSQTPLAGPPALPQGINVAGFLKAQFGIGESSRAFCQAVTGTGLPHTFINIQNKVHSNRDTKVKLSSDKNPYGINLMALSFDYSRRFFLDRGRRFFDGRYNIALWYWELERFPARWHSNFDYYDEIWVPTEFCRRSLAAVSPVPVYKLTYPFHAGETPPRPDRAGLGLPEDAYLFLFNFDFCSTLARKNPLAVIRAFRQAFAPADNAVLVLKSINSEHDPAGRKLIAEALSGLNVVWIEPHISHEQMTTLFASCDCYVSLHRSEGLGLGMAQAMALGKPVIVTGYSGNLDFTRPGNSLLVKHRLVEITEACGSYERGDIWADADVADAAEKMRRLYDHPDEGRQLGQRAAVEVRQLLSPEKTQNEIRERVRQIYEGR